MSDPAPLELRSATSPRSLGADVSVVIPTHRREQWVGGAIRSALAQEGATREVIVLDDTSEGTAREAVRAIGDSRVVYVHRDAPSGGRPALARNEGARLAKGTFVHFLDDDDELVPGALAALRAPLTRNERASVAFGVVVPFGDDAAMVAREEAYFARAAAAGRHALTRYDFAREILFGTAPLICSSCLVRRETLLALGGFDTTMRVCEDYELFVRAIRGHGGSFVDTPVLRHRVAPSSLSHAASHAQTIEAFATIHASYRRQFGSFELHALHAWARVDRPLRAGGATLRRRLGRKTMPAA